MKKGRGCLHYIFYVLLALALLYFTVGEGKTIVMKELFPIKYQDYVERYSAEYGIDKNLVYSVIKVESNFNKDAVSAAGAKGLMQLMEKTAKECNEKGDFGYDIPNDLLVPERNIRLGCFYLRKLIDTYKDARLAVIAYNGGTGNVQKWLENEELSDGKGGLAEIPYNETRKYVKKVFKTFEIYNKLYKTNE